MQPEGGIVLMRLEVGPIRQADPRRGGIVGIVCDIPVGADHVEGANIRQGLEPFLQRVTKAGIVVGHAGGGRQGVTDVREG